MEELGSGHTMSTSEVTASDEDQMAFAAEAAANALSENDAIGESSSLPHDDEDDHDDNDDDDNVNLEDDDDDDAILKNGNAHHLHDTGEDYHEDEDLGDPQPLHLQQHAQLPHFLESNISDTTLSSNTDTTDRNTNANTPATVTHTSTADHSSPYDIESHPDVEHHVDDLSHTPEPHQPLVCRICGRADEEGRPLLRFLPVEHDPAAAIAAPAVLTFRDDIALHLFCGKTASILPHVQQPELEILTKAGLKNKHGIGPEVNAALARTRCAILAPEGAKEKHFYLVREFEAHLAAIRHTHIAFLTEANGAMSNGNHDPFAMSNDFVSHNTLPHHQSHHHHHASLLAHHAAMQPRHPPPHTHHEDYNPTLTASAEHQSSSVLDYATAPAPPQHHSKIAPLRATAGQYQKPSPPRKSSGQPHPAYAHHQSVRSLLMEDETTMPYDAELTPDGRVRCGCGGLHWPVESGRGAQSWRNHILTKRHQKWMEENGLLGVV